MLLGKGVQHHRLCGLGFLSLSYAETEMSLEAFSAEILPNAGFRVFDESLKENWWMSSYDRIVLIVFSPQINLTTSPAAAQLISRAQSISSTPTSISQQTVLLGSPSSPTLTASQAQMYLRAQMVRP